MPLFNHPQSKAARLATRAARTDLEILCGRELGWQRHAGMRLRRLRRGRFSLQPAMLACANLRLLYFWQPSSPLCCPVPSAGTSPLSVGRRKVGVLVLALGAKFRGGEEFAYLYQVFPFHQALYSTCRRNMADGGHLAAVSYERRIVLSSGNSERSRQSSAPDSSARWSIHPACRLQPRSGS